MLNFLSFDEGEKEEKRCFKEGAGGIRGGKFFCLVELDFVMVFAGYTWWKSHP